MNIDVKTLAFALNVLDLLLAAILIFQYRVSRNYSGPGFWALWLVCTSIGVSFLFSRNVLTARVINIIIANSLILFGILLLYSGVLRFQGKKENRLVLIIIMGVYALFLAWFTFLDDNFMARTVGSAAIFGILSLVVARELFIYKDLSIKAAARFSGLVLSFFGLVFLIRAVDAIFFTEPDNMFMQHWFQIYTFLATLIAHVLLTFGLVLMVNLRLQGDLDEDKKALLREQYLMNALMNNLPDSIYFKDRDSRFVRINKAHAELFGLTAPGEEAGKSDFDFFTVEHARKAYEDEQRIILTGETLIHEEKETWAERPDTWVSTVKMPLKDQEGNLIGTFGISHDITERKKAEEELDLKNRQLETSNAEKDKLFSIIAHDLRSPFNALLGLSELLSGEADDLTPAEMSRAALSIGKSARSLNDQLGNLLEWSRIQMHVVTINPEVVNLRLIADIELHLFREAANLKNISLTNLIPEAAQISYDKHMLQSILRNLLANAIKFTRTGGEVLLKTTNENDKITGIQVCDTGIGLSADLMGRIFKLNGQSSRKGTNGEPSSGLGLIICHELAGKHGGQILVTSEENVGSIFTLTLR